MQIVEFKRDFYDNRAYYAGESTNEDLSGRYVRAEIAERMESALKLIAKAIKEAQE